MLGEKAKDVAMYGLFCAQFSGWQGNKIVRLSRDMVPNNENSPDGWHEMIVQARDQINGSVLFHCNPGNGLLSLLRPMQITGIPPAENPPKQFRGMNGEVPDGCIDYEVRGIPHAVGLHEIPQAQADGTMQYQQQEPIDGKTIEQNFFEAVLALGNEWVCWYGWEMFLDFIDPDIDDYKRWYAVRGFERRLARRKVKSENEAGKAAMLTLINQWQATQEKPSDDLTPDV